MSTISKLELDNTRVILDKTKQYIDKKDDEIKKYINESDSCKIKSIELNGEPAPIVDKTVSLGWDPGTQSTYVQGSFDPGTQPTFSQGVDTYESSKLNSLYKDSTLILNFQAGQFTQGKDILSPGTLPQHGKDVFIQGLPPELGFISISDKSTMMTSDISNYDNLFEECSNDINSNTSFEVSSNEFIINSDVDAVDVFDNEFITNSDNDDFTEYSK